MKCLWDTHTFLWWVTGSPRLSETAKATIADAMTEPWMSVASVWQMSIKVSLGKLDISGSFEEVMDDIYGNGIQLLPITFYHTLQQYKLPFHHRDPFDRMIVSQAIAEDMSIISADSQLDAYSIRRIW